MFGLSVIALEMLTENIKKNFFSKYSLAFLDRPQLNRKFWVTFYLYSFVIDPFYSFFPIVYYLVVNEGSTYIN